MHFRFTFNKINPEPQIHSSSIFQVEVQALQAALFRGNGNDTSDYRLAQASMDRLDRLEDALWEAHRREASAATLSETRKLQVRDRLGVEQWTRGLGAFFLAPLRVCLTEQSAT